MSKGGRRAKLNKDLIDRFCEQIAKGLFRSAAASLVSVHESQVSRWYARGSNEERGIYREFFDAVNAAEAQYQADCLAQMQQAAARDPRHLQWLLSRRFPALYGRKDNVEEPNLTDKAAEQSALRESLLERLNRLLPDPAPLAQPQEAPNGE